MGAVSRRQFLKNASAAAAVGVLGCEAQQRRPADAPGLGDRSQQKPNVLFIMSDQHNSRALGCYGNNEVQTPNLDRLARRGVRLENAFCQTGQCCPSRYTIWTGRYAHSHGLRWNHVIEPLEEITVGEVFRDAGYATATIGKHHMQYDVRLHGFDHVVNYSDYVKSLAGSGAQHCWASGDWLPYEQASFAGPVGTSHADNDHHMAGYWAHEAINFLRANRAKPFCMWLSFHGPHVPFVASQRWMELYDSDSLTLPPNFHRQRAEAPEDLRRLWRLMDGLSAEDFRAVLRCYYALVSQIDHNIGRVLDELERLNLADNTIVVYTSDHGEMMGEHGTFRKAVLNYDATVRVPLIIRMPGAARGHVVDELAGLIDLMPTLCEAAGISCPEAVQGRSLVPLLRRGHTAWREVIFSEIGYPRPGFPIGLCTMARTKQHKYIHHDNSGQPMEELYDLRGDPWETVNQANNPEFSAVLTRLRTAVADWRANTDHAPLYPIEKEFRQDRRPD